MKRLVLVALMMLVALPVRSEEVVSADFFAGYYLEVLGQGPFFRVELPEEVYTKVRRPDFADIRVFNGAGEVLPHALRSLEQPVQAKRSAVPFFPLHGQGDDAASANLAVEVVRDGTGTIVTVKDQGQDGPVRPVRAYLLDVGGGKRTAGNLELHWQLSSPSSIFTARLEQSDDLRTWRRLVSAAPLVDLHHHGERVEMREIALTSPPQRYLRLSWSESQPLLLTEATLAGETSPPGREYQWSDLGPGGVTTAQGRLDIHYQGDLRLPVTTARLHFNRPNSLARIHLQSRGSDKEGWRSRCHQAFYALTYGEALVRKDSCVFAPTVDTQWRAIVEEDGAAIGTSQVGPSLFLGRTASELLFVARGNPPFLLAFGSERLAPTPQRGGDGLVLEALDATDASSRISPAQLGRRIELGGEPVLRPRPAAPPWKTWLLWAVLLLGVTMLAVMARCLVREMSESKEKAATKDV